MSFARSKLYILPIGHSLSLFLAITFVVCVLFGLIAPEKFEMHKAWSPLLPGFVWLTPMGFLIGLVEAYLYGWYIAVVFVPIHNFIQTRAQTSL